MKKLILLFSLAILFALSGVKIFACSCSGASRSEVEALTDTEILRLANFFDDIFIGQVVSKKIISGNWKVTFAVEKYWKGINSKRVTVYTSVTEASCGVTFEIGKQYLVPAFKQTNKLDVDLCPYLTFNENQDIFLKKLGKSVSIRDKNK